MAMKLKEKSYRLTNDRSAQSFTLKVGRNRRLLTFDEEKGYNRAIRHCPNEPSIFVDSQSEFAVVEPIIFITGYKHTKKEEQTTQKFLDTHPDNVANGGYWFEEVNDSVEAKEVTEVEELIMDIKQAVRDKAKEEDGVHALEAVVSVLTGSAETALQMSKEELKREIYLAIDRNPSNFINDEGEVTIFEDDRIFRKHFVLLSLRNGILKKSTNNRTIMWGDSKKVIATAPKSVDTIDYFSDFLTTDEGMLIFDEMKRR